MKDRKKAKKQILKYLDFLCGQMSVSGFESLSSPAVSDAFAPMFDEVRSMMNGNLLFLKKSPLPNAPTLLIDTHFDEIGMIVTGVEEGGFLRFAPVGGLDIRTLPSAPVKLYADDKAYDAVIVSTPPHLQKAEDEKKLPAISDLFIDAGYPKETAEKLFPPGTPARYAGGVTALRHDRIAGRAFDDKLCAAAALFAVSELESPALPAHLALLFSVREELSLLGAKTGAYEIAPDAAIVMDGNIGATDDSDDAHTVILGKGPSLSLSATTDRPLTLALQSCAERHKHPYQWIAEPSSTGTNADIVSLMRSGIPTAVMSLPLRNMHSPCEAADLSDALSCALLLADFIKEDFLSWYSTQNS